jgi:hypothetical protein
MTTPAKLYGKDLSEYDDIDVDTLLAQLSAEEISILAKEVDPDVSILKLRNLSVIFIDRLCSFRTHSCLQTSVTATNVQNHQPGHSTARN